MQNRVAKINQRGTNKPSVCASAHAEIMVQVNTQANTPNTDESLHKTVQINTPINDEPASSGSQSSTTAVDSDVMNPAEMVAHLQKFQNFFNAWVVRQSQLLGRADSLLLGNVGATPNDVHIQFGESAPQKVERGAVPGGGKYLRTPSTTSELESVPEVGTASYDEPAESGSPDVEVEPPGSGYHSEAEVNSLTAIEDVETDFELIQEACRIGSKETPDYGDAEDKSPCRPSSRKSIASEDLSRVCATAYMTGNSEVRRRGVCTLENMVGQKGFEFLCVFVIFCNAIVIGMSTDYAMDHPSNPTSKTLSNFELSFIIFYTVEMCLRMCVKGRLYFTEKTERNWNLFDVVLVGQGVSEQVMTMFDEGQADGASSLTNLRLFRLMKLVKLLRMVRLLRMFKELRLILSSISGCLISMLWAGILIVGISYVFGIAIVQGCAFHLEEFGDKLDATTAEGIDAFWSSTAQAVLSLSMSTTGGEDWIRVASPLRQVGGFFYALFLLYIAIFVFVVMNIINSIFLESILSHAERDHQLIIETQMEKKEEYVANLQIIFQDMDIDGDGEVTYDEFCNQLYCPRMQAFVASLEMEITDAKKFFEVLSDRGRRSVDIATFVVGCIKLRGPAKSVDLADLAFANKRAHHEQLKAFKQLSSLRKIANETRLVDQRLLQNFDKLLDYVQQMSSRPQPLEGYDDSLAWERSPGHPNEEMRALYSEVDVSPKSVLAPGLVTQFPL